MTWSTTTIVPKNYISDVAPSALPVDVVSSLSNVDFFAGQPRSLSSSGLIWTPVQPPRNFGFHEYSGLRRWVYGTDVASAVVYNFDGTIQANVTPVTGLTRSLYWDFDAFSGYQVFTNFLPNEAPHYLSAANSVSVLAAPLPGWVSGHSCKLIRAHRNYLIAINTLEGGVHYGSRVRWSNSAVAGSLPTSWTAAINNDAGAYDPAVPGGEIVDAAVFGDTVYLGGRGGIWTMTYIGGTYVYAFEQRSTAHGLRGYGCMVSLGDSIAVLTQSDVVQIDSSSERSLLIGKHARTMFKAIGLNTKLVYINQARQLLVLFGTGKETGYSRALVWDRDTDTWGYRVFDRVYDCVGKGLDNRSVLEQSWDALAGKYTWDTWNNRGSWDKTAFATDAYFYILGISGGVYGPGVTYNWTMTREGLPFAGGRFGRVHSLRANISGTSGQTISMRIGTSQSSGEDTTWGEQRNYTLGNDELLHCDLQRGAYMAYQISGNGSATLASVEVQYKEQGRNR